MHPLPGFPIPVLKVSYSCHMPLRLAGRAPPVKKRSIAALVSSVLRDLRSVTHSETVDTTSRAVERCSLQTIGFLFKSRCVKFLNDLYLIDV